MQNLISSLNRLPFISDNSENPQLQRSYSSTVASSSIRGLKSCQISGSYTFYLNPELNNRDNNDQLTQNSIITINAFTDSTCKYAIGVSCRWYRVINEKNICIPLQTNTYQLSAYDIGCSIRCEVKSEEEDYQGTSNLLFGPIIMDILLKSKI